MESDSNVTSEEDSELEINSDSDNDYSETESNYDDDEWIKWIINFFYFSYFQVMLISCKIPFHRKICEILTKKLLCWSNFTKIFQTLDLLF